MYITDTDTSKMNYSALLKNDRKWWNELQLFITDRNLDWFGTPTVENKISKSSINGVKIYGVRVGGFFLTLCGDVHLDYNHERSGDIIPEDVFLERMNKLTSLLPLSVHEYVYILLYCTGSWSSYNITVLDRDDAADIYRNQAIAKEYTPGVRHITTAY